MTSSTPIELDKEFIISAIEERGGEIKYLDLVNIFKKVLYQADHQERELQRKRFKDLLTCAARLVEVEGEPRVILRPPSHGNLTRGQGCDPEAFISLDFPDEDGKLPTQWDPGSPDPAGQSGGERQEGDEKDDRSSCIPEVVITQADEGKWEEIAALGKPRAGEAVWCPDDPGWKSPSDGQDLHSDLQSLRSESGSLASDVAASGSAKSDVDQDCLDDDLRSITTSSVTSLFPRLQLDPLERAWIHLAALGDTVALSQLLRQDPSLASKKHGYTALHIAALHGHSQIIQLLVNTYNAKANIRDYHGKMPTHYWTGNADIFNTPSTETCGQWEREGRRSHRHSHLPSLLLGSWARGQWHLATEDLSSPEVPPARGVKVRSPSCTKK